jgi:hypothetical protein
MNISWDVILWLLVVPTATVGFAPSSIQVGRATTQLSAEPRQSSIQQWIGKAVTTAAVTASLWAAPSLQAAQNTPDWLTINGKSNPFVASAVEKASGTGSRVNKDADSLLRLGLPINNKEVRIISHTIFGGTMASKRPMLSQIPILPAIPVLSSSLSTVLMCCHVRSENYKNRWKRLNTI